MVWHHCLSFSSIRNELIQLHNIHFGCMTRIIGENFRKMIGNVKEVDVDEEVIGWDPYL